MSGKPLLPELINLARAEEVNELNTRSTLKHRLRGAWQRPASAPIGRNPLGDSEHPEYRYRLVAHELKRCSVLEDLSAATPPLQANSFYFRER